MGIECKARDQQQEEEKRQNDDGEMATLIFTYGTLKRGFSNHGLMQDLIRAGDASYRGPHRTAEPYPLVCGPYRVPFLLNLPGAGGAQRVAGEVYAVSARGLARLDELEGTARGHYERLPIEVVEAEGAAAVAAEAYFGHRSYAGEMWRRSGKRGYGVYGEKESVGYIRRKDRPQGISFLDQIYGFVSNLSPN